jgi:hypothetical protein
MTTGFTDNRLGTTFFYYNCFHPNPLSGSLIENAVSKPLLDNVHVGQRLCIRQNHSGIGLGRLDLSGSKHESLACRVCLLDLHDCGRESTRPGSAFWEVRFRNSGRRSFRQPTSF